MQIHPFRDSDVHATFENVVQHVLTAIDALESEYVLKASPTELKTYFTAEAQFEPIVLHIDQRYIESQRTIQIDVSRDFQRFIRPGVRTTVAGTQLQIANPFEGTPELWKVRPSTYSLGGYPEIEIHRDRVVITVKFPDDAANQENLTSEVERHVKSLEEATKNQLRDVERHNQSVIEKIESRLTAKREKSKAAVGVVAGLGIPMKRRQEPAFYGAPVMRRPGVSRPKPVVTTEKSKPEPVLDEEEYDYILNVLRSMSLVIERNSKSFSGLDEESIRDHFLLQLNGHYEGAATGETFNAVGKTDILIRVEDRNVFIAECKFWRGPKAFDEAVDQLLSYLSWRDCKCAVMVFNRNQGTTAVLEKMHEVMKGRKECKKTIIHDVQGECRYVFVKDSDPGREIVITTNVFDIPKGN